MNNNKSLGEIMEQRYIFLRQLFTAYFEIQPDITKKYNLDHFDPDIVELYKEYLALKSQFKKQRDIQIVCGK